MRVFIAILILIMSLSAHAEQVCAPGQYDAGWDCRVCLSGYYCPDDDSDSWVPCPDDTTDWKTLLESCGYHLLEEITPPKYEVQTNSAAEYISECFVGPDWHTDYEPLLLQEGLCRIRQYYNPARGDYWNGCDGLKYFYSANDGYYLSRFYLTGYGNWYFNENEKYYYAIKPCTNAPENAHYTGPGTPDDPVESGGKTDYNDCPWACDDGYTLQDGACVSTLCAAGYYRPTADAECTACPNGYYCPGDDKSDDAIACPADTTDWNTLLEGCGYHPLQDIKSNSIDSWGHNAPAAEISNCYARSKVNKFKEGLWEMELPYGSQRNDYWHGCDTLKFFYAANPGYYLSTYNSTTYEDWYYYIKPCTNEHPANSHYSGPGTPDDPVKTGGKTDYNDCPWECDDGYGLHNGTCMPLCTAGATKFHVGDYVFNIYKDKLTTLAINIELGTGTVCYVPLVDGSGKGALNVDYHGVIYHTSD